MCDLLKTIFRPNFEDPIDSAKQLIENNISVLAMPGGQYYETYLANSPIPEYQTLSKHLIIAKDWNEFDYLIKHAIIENGTMARMAYCLWNEHKTLGRWWKGNLIVGDSPYVGYLSDKKWNLNEALNIFRLID